MLTYCMKLLKFNLPPAGSPANCPELGIAPNSRFFHQIGAGPGKTARKPHSPQLATPNQATSGLAHRKQSIEVFPVSHTTRIFFLYGAFHHFLIALTANKSHADRNQTATKSQPNRNKKQTETRQILENKRREPILIATNAIFGASGPSAPSLPAILRGRSLCSRARACAILPPAAAPSTPMSEGAPAEAWNFGLCATIPREPRQARKGATVTGQLRVPRNTRSSSHRARERKGYPSRP